MKIGVGHYSLQVLGVVQLLKRLAEAKIFDNLVESDNLNQARTTITEPMPEVEKENFVARVQDEVKIFFALECVLGVGPEANVEVVT